MPPGDTPKRKAKWLILPSLIISIYAIPCLPWLLKTRDRLNNAYWEGQLLFAFVALAVAVCGVPFVLLRIFRRIRIVSIIGWIIITLGYSGLFAYIVQSHFHPFVRLPCAAMGLVCITWAIEGFLMDLNHRER